MKWHACHGVAAPALVIFLTSRGMDIRSPLTSMWTVDLTPMTAGAGRGQVNSDVRYSPHTVLSGALTPMMHQ